MNKYFCFIIFHFSSTLQFDFMLENELFAFTLFPMGINDSGLDQIGLRTLSERILVENRGTTVLTNVKTKHFKN